jgi:peptidoglycan hydrolase CwlO-like protein
MTFYLEETIENIKNEHRNVVDDLNHSISHLQTLVHDLRSDKDIHEKEIDHLSQENNELRHLNRRLMEEVESYGTLIETSIPHEHANVDSHANHSNSTLIPTNSLANEMKFMTCPEEQYKRRIEGIFNLSYHLYFQN